MIPTPNLRGRGLQDIDSACFNVNDYLMKMADGYRTFFFFYKNIFYKNIEAEICEILRIF